MGKQFQKKCTPNFIPFCKGYGSLPATCGRVVSIRHQLCRVIGLTVSSKNILELVNHYLGICYKLSSKEFFGVLYTANVLDAKIATISCVASPDALWIPSLKLKLSCSNF